MATISRYSLISVDELKEALQGGFTSSPSSLDPTLASVCNKASDAIERYLDRKVIARGALVNSVWTITPVVSYFTPPSRTPRLYLREWPIISISSIYEDASRVYASSSLLTADTDYVVTKPPDDHGYVTRLFGNWSLYGAMAWQETGVVNGGFWASSFRSVKMTYTAGYADTASVPDAIKFETLKLAVKLWGEWKSGMSDIGGEQGPMGHYSRLSTAYITDRMKEALYAFKRPPFDPGYEERDAA